jgi:hypothetical protein
VSIENVSLFNARYYEEVGVAGCDYMLWLSLLWVREANPDIRIGLACRNHVVVIRHENGNVVSLVMLPIVKLSIDTTLTQPLV